MNDTKRRIEIFSFFNQNGIRDHLEKMAQKGWMIEKLTNFGWIYRPIEPKKIRFAVSYYPKASEFDPEPSEEQKTFHDFCAHTGWELACASAQLQIFYNERETSKQSQSWSWKPFARPRKRIFFPRILYCSESPFFRA